MVQINYDGNGFYTIDPLTKEREPIPSTMYLTHIIPDLMILKTFKFQDLDTNMPVSV